MADVSTLLDKFSKAYKRDVTLLSDDDPPRIGTGFFAFDLATGGGFPIGRTSVVYGPEASMKSTLCLKALANAQRMYPNLKHVFVDLEGTFVKSWARTMGVDVDELVVITPVMAEEAVDMITNLLYAEDVGLVVLDSLAAMITSREIDSDTEDAMVGVAGLVVNKFYRRVTRALTVARLDSERKSIPTLLLINQIRYKIGVMFGDPETMPGGPSFKYGSSMIVRLYGKEEIDKGVSQRRPAYMKISAIIKKSKVPIVGRTSEFRVALLENEMLGLRVGESDDWRTIMSYLKSLAMLEKSDGGWTVMSEEYAKQEDIKQRLREDPEFADALKAAIIERVLVEPDLD